MLVKIDYSLEAKLQNNNLVKKNVGSVRTLFRSVRLPQSLINVFFKVQISKPGLQNIRSYPYVMLGNHRHEDWVRPMLFISKLYIYHFFTYYHLRFKVQL